MADAVDWSNPCAKFQALQAAYFSLISGQQEAEIRTRTLDAEDLVRFSKIDINTLRAEMRKAESECARTTGAIDPNRRFAIGCRRRGYPIPPTMTDPNWR